MLKPAVMYEKQLYERSLKCIYNPRYMYYFSGSGQEGIRLPNEQKFGRYLVSVDKDENVLGYIGYALDYETMTADQWGIVCFKENGSIEFAKDVYQAIYDCFTKYGFERVAWYCYADNPALRGYKNFIKRYGGRISGYFRNCTRLLDGKLQDSVSFEIMRDEFISALDNKGEGILLKDIKVPLPIHDYDIVKNLTDRVIEDRENYKLDIYVRSVVLEDGTEIDGWKMYVSPYTDLWYNGVFNMQVKSSVNPNIVYHVADILSGSVDKTNMTMTLNSSSGDIKAVRFRGWIKRKKSSTELFEVEKYFNEQK